jgi:hypothetical protein
MPMTCNISPTTFTTATGELIQWVDIPTAERKLVLLRNPGMCSCCGIPGHMEPREGASWWLVDVVHVGGVDTIFNTEWQCNLCNAIAPTTREGLAQLQCVGATASKPQTLFMESYIKLVASIEGENGSLSAVHLSKSQLNLGKDRTGSKKTAGFRQNRNSNTVWNVLQHSLDLTKGNNSGACACCT